jgi:hypothetical protein
MYCGAMSRPVMEVSLNVIISFCKCVAWTPSECSHIIVAMFYQARAQCISCCGQQVRCMAHTTMLDVPWLLGEAQG